ncbi:peroxiredoxin [Gloeocapsopsis sp. IPPAS B-1203]|uniref:peroxiredoxin n=1 Tax=Gloeocapsopsis sp. IPPAS B-1203 TaxID=2049454 RepID=UPI000C197632|nr:peroxiredoxin [Gloeocapsopsis sp. IPPAS B-1203]PIG94523.1 peroxiredoxin [Gloeocapsopsis sp. IPPAS B-1203]
MQNLTELPQDLPIPQYDGGCNHLLGMRLPQVNLISTRSRKLDLSNIKSKVVFYCYPMTGQPSVPIPDGWDQIPGARGCTPQSCAFRDHYAELQELGVEVYGISTQDTSYQQEAVERLHLPFELLSDAAFEFTTSLQLPTFEVDGKRLIKRLTLIADEGKIAKVFYPVFPPDKNAQEVIKWLKQNLV